MREYEMNGEWRTIESAPKGKKLIVGYPNRLGKWRTVIARYYLPDTLVMADDSDDEYGAEGWYEESESHEYILPTDGTPTHWMPLPPPPSPRNVASATPVDSVSPDENRVSQ